MKYSLKNVYKSLLKEDLVDLSDVTDDIGIAQVRLPDDSDKVRIYRVTANTDKSKIKGSLEKEFDITGIKGIRDKLSSRLKVNSFDKNEKEYNFIKKTFENKVIQDIESLFINSYVNRNNIIFNIMKIHEGDNINLIDEETQKTIDTLANLTNNFSSYMKSVIDGKITNPASNIVDLSDIHSQSGGRFDVLQSYSTKNQSPRSAYFNEIVKDTLIKQFNVNDDVSIVKKVFFRLNKGIKTLKTPSDRDTLKYDYGTGALYFENSTSSEKTNEEKLDDSRVIYLISLLHVITNLGSLDDYNSVQKMYNQPGEEVDKDILSTNIMREYSNEFNDAKLFNIVSNIEIRKLPAGIDDVITTLNENDILFKEFSPANRIGRGEFACHLLFKTSNCFLPIEPDAVIESENGILKCSVKSFMSSSGNYLSDAQTGTNMSSNIRVAYEELLTSLNLKLDGKQEAIIKQLCEDYFVFIAHLLSDKIKLTADNVKNLKTKSEGKNFVIKRLLSVNDAPSSNMSAELKAEYLGKLFDISAKTKSESDDKFLERIRDEIKTRINISNVKTKLGAVKKAVVSEHGAKFVICFDNKYGAYKFDVDKDDVERVAIKNVTESRTSFNIVKQGPANNCRFKKGIDQIGIALKSQQNNSFYRRGMILKEVFSNLYKKKIINEGGLAGHMMHPYEALDMTPRQIIDKIKEYSTSQEIIEKVDGQNLFFTVEQDGTLMFARNKEDMTHDDLVEKFTGHPAELPFVEGGNAIKSGVDQWLASAGDASEMEIREIFHPDGETKSFVNFEIMHPDKPNQIIYDEKYIVFHSIVDFVNGRETVYSTNKGQRLEKLIRLMSSGVSSSGFNLASNRTVNLNQLSNVQIEDYVNRIKEISQQLNINEDEFLGDGIEKQIKLEIESEGITISNEAASLLYDFALYGETKSGEKIKSRDFTSMMSKEDASKLRSIGLTSSAKALKKVQKIISPFKEIFVDLGIDLLKDVKSSYMSDETNQMNIDLLKDKLQTAVDDLIDYMNNTSEEYWESEVHRLRPHLDKVIDTDIDQVVSTAVEGGVYDNQGDLLKVTGGFAPMNQILGAAYRDRKGIFPTFKQKFMKQESKNMSLKNVYKILF